MVAIISQTIQQTYQKRVALCGTLDLWSYPPSNMEQPSSKASLWNAVGALMRKRFGGENLNRLAREAKFGLATASRMKAQETSVGLETLDKLADAFDVEPWQLLVPGFNPDAPPYHSVASPMAQDIAHMLDAITDEGQRRRAYAVVVQVLQFGGDSLGKEPSPSKQPSAGPLHYS